MKTAPILCLLATAAACAADLKLYTTATHVMGTVATVKIYVSEEAAARKQASLAFAELRRLDDIFTNYRDSELTRLNRNAAGGPVKLSQDMAELVRLSLEYSRKYGGAFDITIGPAIRAWGFLGGPFRVPRPGERNRLRHLVGIDGLQFDPHRRMLSFRRRGMELDFGGIAKGFAVEKAARLLLSSGVERALINLGGSSFYALGPPPAMRSWPVGVLDPRPPHHPLITVELPPFSALSTSGTYGRSFRKGEILYTHVFDPRTAEPASLEGSATVICASGAESEAASKAILLITPEHRSPPAEIEWLRVEVIGGKLSVCSSQLLGVHR